MREKDADDNLSCVSNGSFHQFAVSKYKGLWAISFFEPQNENDVTSLIDFPLFRTLLTNHNLLIYALENITHNSLDSETVIWLIYDL